MKYSKVQYDLWRVRARLDRKLAKMTPEEMREHFDQVLNDFEERTGTRLQVIKAGRTMQGKGQTMDELRLYIETSVWSNWYADDAPEWRAATQEFLRACRAAGNAVVLYVSQLVMDELQAASAALADDFVRLVREHATVMLRPDAKAFALAEAYAAHGAIPPSRKADRLHAAIATVAEVDMLVSWNYRHLVNASRRQRITSVNRFAGYPRGLEILTPPEVFEDEVQ